MYTSDHEHMVEDKCFQVTHIQKVLNVIKANFQGFFDKFLESQQSYISPDRVDELHDKFIVDFNGKHLVFDRSRACKECNCIMEQRPSIIRCSIRRGSTKNLTSESTSAEGSTTKDALSAIRSVCLVRSFLS